MITPFADLQGLHGKIVLVTSTKDTGNPPAGRRGTIDVRPVASGERPVVRIVLQLPDMFNVPAHEDIVTLDDSCLHQLLASERGGTYQLVIDKELS